MIKLFVAIVSLILCFFVSLGNYKSYCENEQNEKIQLILHTLSTENIKIYLDKTKYYDPYLLYRNLRSYILSNILFKAELDNNLVFKVSNNDTDEGYSFEFVVLNKSDLCYITYI